MLSMLVESFFDALQSNFFTGIPDSCLSPFCSFLIEKYGRHSIHHIIGANEGTCVGIAAGHYLSTGEIPVVYLQNSGIGNIVNPVTSLLNKSVFGIPIIFVIGWRGEPGVYDEPQHIFQGRITDSLLNTIGLEVFHLNNNTTYEDVKKIIDRKTENGFEKQLAFVVSKGVFDRRTNNNMQNKYLLKRKDVIANIVKIAENDLIISTTGKISRELNEIRCQGHQSHFNDLLTVGSMGHSSSIALGISLSLKQKKIWCLDGDGAVLMHMGALATIGRYHPCNFVHVLLNNESYESVGGFPNGSEHVSFPDIAKACGYINVFSVDNDKDFHNALDNAKHDNTLWFIEVKTALELNSNPIRPLFSPNENKRMFMSHVHDD